MLEICSESMDDNYEVEALYDLCFAPGRSALSSYRLREGIARVNDLSLIIRDTGVLLAAIRFWPVRVAGHKGLLLGPIAVHPTAQGEGLGALLMRDSLARARKLGWARVILVGDEPYYRRFGFFRLDGVIMPAPTNPDRVLGLGLQPGAWQGVRGEVERDLSAALAEADQMPHIEAEDVLTEQSRADDQDDKATADFAADH